MKKQFLIVTAPVANLREEPLEASSGYVHDDLQKSQLLRNEILLCKAERDDWYSVEAIEQKKAAPGGGWSGYPGWVKKGSVMFLDELPMFNAVVWRQQATITAGPADETECLFLAPMGTRLTIKDSGNADYYKTVFSEGHEGWVRKKEVNRKRPVTDVLHLRYNIVETAKLFLDVPYLWGGRNTLPFALRSDLPTPNFLTHNAGDILRGVDCSALTNLAYRAHSLDIPRDACDQWKVSMHISYDTREPADLIFVSAEDAHDTIIHVMLYIGGEEFIEASDAGNVAAISTFEKKYGMKLCDIASGGFIVDKKKIVFASILGNPDKT